MGIRACKCVGAETKKRNSEPIVPDKDPLLRSSLTTRIVHDDIAKHFDITSKVLGTGYSGAVRLAQHKESKRPVAVKQFCKRQLKDHRWRLLQSEVEVYLRLDHPNVCRLLHAYETSTCVWLVMELCSSELYSRLCQRKVYTEGDAADVMLQMFQAVNYLHSHCIVHRDLKLENWLYSANKRDDRLKLIDFGFSRALGSPDESLDMPCGTLHYTSPEVLARKYTSKCDIWSLGVICYMLLLGRPPFRGQNNLKIAKAIISGEFAKEGRWTSLSPAAQNFIERLLLKDVTRRLDAAEALAHPWLVGCASRNIVATDIGVDVLKNLRQFAQGSHLRRAALTLLAYTLTSQELKDLEQTFLDFDRSGQGTITSTQLAQVLREYCKAADRPEMSSQEVQRIFECLDVSGEDEIHYTPFVAAMLGARVKLHETKIREAFDAFDTNGSGFITAESLIQIYSSLPGCVSSTGSTLGSSTFGAASTYAPTSSSAAGVLSSVRSVGGYSSSSKCAGGSIAKSSSDGRLSREEAERWIQEVDYKGNGTIDFEEFLDALMGKKLWSKLGGSDEPTIRVFDEDEVPGGRPRGNSDPWEQGSSWNNIRVGLASAIIDPSDEDDSRFRPQSFQSLDNDHDHPLQVRTVACRVDEHHFMCLATS